MIKITQNPFIGWIDYRINKKNRNAVISFNGSPGSGKSWACVSFARDLSKVLGSDFSPRLNMDFDFYSLMEKMELPQHKKGKGNIFIFEEVGTTGSGASYREWHSKFNKFFQSFLCPLSQQTMPSVF